jgi:hypothetical protein
MTPKNPKREGTSDRHHDYGYTIRLPARMEAARIYPILSRLVENDSPKEDKI